MNIEELTTFRNLMYLGIAICVIIGAVFTYFATTSNNSLNSLKREEQTNEIKKNAETNTQKLSQGLNEVSNEVNSARDTVIKKVEEGNNQNNINHNVVNQDLNILKKENKKSDWLKCKFEIAEFNKIVGEEYLSTPNYALADVIRFSQKSLEERRLIASELNKIIKNVMSNPYAYENKKFYEEWSNLRSELITYLDYFSIPENTQGVIFNATRLNNKKEVLEYIFKEVNRIITMRYIKLQIENIQEPK
jgi:lipopolysaccharide export LptBFGC system permease protein LptF